MNRLAHFTAGAALATAIILNLPTTEPETTTVYQTEVFTREVLTTIDLKELEEQIVDLDQQLYVECINVIQRHTDDPRAGIIHLVERHYDGNACQAADEAARGLW
jgi:hypothetical protein